MAGRENYRKRLEKLKTGVRVAWFVNYAILFVTFEACIIWARLSVYSTNKEIAQFLLYTIPISLVLSWLAMKIVSWGSPKLVMARSCEGMEEVTDGVVFDVVQEMSIAARLDPMPKVFIADTTAINAYAMSDGHEYCVVFTRPLLKMVNREELKGIAGHEIGHIVMQDCEAMTKLVALTSTVSLIAGYATRLMGGSRSNDSSSKNANPVAIVLLMFSLVFLLVAPLLSVVARMFMSRERESQADATSVKLTRNPNALARALLAIETASTRSDGGVDALQSATSRKFYKSVGDMAFWGPRNAMASHPPTRERIDALVRMGADPGFEKIAAGLSS